MVDCDETSFVEEENVGFNLLPILFEPTNRFFYAISGKNIFSYEIESGKHQKILCHSEQVIALHFINKKLLSITKNGTLTEWNLNNGAELSKFFITSEMDLLWTYEVSNENSEVDKNIYVFGQKKPYSNGSLNEMDVDGSLSDVPVNVSFLFQLFLNETNNTISPKLKRVIDIPERVTSRNQLAVAFDLAVLAFNRNVKIIPFFPNKRPINGPLNYTHRTKISTLDNKNLAFNEVLIIEDLIYVSMNIGRLYYWNRIREIGLDRTNKSFINICDCTFVSVILKNRTIITGDGDCTLSKWNLSTSGGGRWHRAEYLDFEAPIERVLNNDDSSYVVVVLLDNSLYIVKTSTMTIQSQAQVLNWHFTISPLEWSKLTVDIANLDLVVTNSRIGQIQWFDPDKWRTVATYDICEENPPPKDHFNLVNYLWSNVYLTHFTCSRFVTCECRRNDLNRSYTKIYLRIKPCSITDFRLEECIVNLKKILFIRSNYDEILSNIFTNEELSAQEFIRIDCDGCIDVIIADSRRIGRWRIDDNRSNINWRRSKIQSCSRVRQNVFLTVNEVVENNKKRRFVVIWQLPVVLRVFQIVECVDDAKYVEWAPFVSGEKSIVLIACDSKIVGYDPEVASVLWITNQSGFSLFSSLYHCFAYDTKRIIWFDSLTGKLKKVQKFSCTQNQIIATGSHVDIRINGLSEKGLSVLKKDLTENAILNDISVTVKKKTPFFELLSKTMNGYTGKTDSFLRSSKKLLVELQPKAPLASKIFDAPAYSLPSMSVIGPHFIQACMIPKQKNDQVLLN